MAQQEDTTQQKTQKGKEGFWGSMSGVQKALLLIFAVSIFFVMWNFLFGGIKNFYQLIFFVISFVAIAGLFLLVLTMISWYLAPALFSPKKDFFNKIVVLAALYKPNNVFDLWFRGDRDKQKVRAGKIIGLLGMPYLIGLPKLYEKDTFDEAGKLIGTEGTPVYRHSQHLKRDIPVYDKIEYGKDGDTLFIYEAGWFLFKKKHFLRCHRSLHGDLNGDVFIDDINPQPYGNWEYPFKQWQAEQPRIMLQNQLEIIIATHEHQGDLISQGVDAAVYFNPTFRLLQKQNAEMVSGEG